MLFHVEALEGPTITLLPSPPVSVRASCPALEAQGPFLAAQQLLRGKILPSLSSPYTAPLPSSCLLAPLGFMSLPCLLMVAGKWWQRDANTASPGQHPSRVWKMKLHNQLFLLLPYCSTQTHFLSDSCAVMRKKKKSLYLEVFMFYTSPLYLF